MAGKDSAPKERWFSRWEPLLKPAGIGIKWSAAAITVVGVVASGFLTWSTYQLTQEQFKKDTASIVSDHFNAAVDDLASTDPATRLAGVLILTRIGRDTPTYHDDVMSFLEGLLRGRSQPTTPGDFYKCQSWDKTGAADLAQAMAAVVQLSRQDAKDHHVIQLNNTCLRNADLRGADLRGAQLDGSDLSGTNLSGVDLSGASLQTTILQGAFLDGADLDRAAMALANLQCAFAQTIKLDGTDLSNVLTHNVQIPVTAAAKAINVPSGFGTTGAPINPQIHPIGSPDGCSP